MKKLFNSILKSGFLFLIIVVLSSTGCQQKPDNSDLYNAKTETPEYFNLRPEAEKNYG